MKSAVLILVLMLSVISLFSQVAEAPSAGDGSGANPYHISTWQNLYWLSQNSAQWSRHYIQTADIDFTAASPNISTWDSNKGFRPIGNGSTNFTGSYNGNGHKIVNLYIARPSETRVGLFGTISGQIQKLGVENVTISGGSPAAGIVASMNSPASISQCYVKNASITCSGDTAGALIGHTSNALVADCYAFGTVTTNNGITGGVIGWAASGSSAITRIYGVTVPTSGIYRGSLSGWTNVPWTYSRWDSSVYAAGFGNTSGLSITDVVGKTTAQMKIQSNYPSNWDFTDVWGIDSSINNGYPYLKCFALQAPQAATNPIPDDTSSEIAINANLSWSAGSGGAASAYKLYFGTNYPPSNLLNGTDIGTTPSYNPSADLLYGTTYYWQVVPENAAGQASSCPIWSFTTIDYYQEQLDPVLPPVGDPVVPVVTFPGLSGSFSPPIITTTWAIEGAPDNAGLGVIIDSGNLPLGRRIEINPDLGFVPEDLAWRIVPGAWTFVPRITDGINAWRTDFAWFDLPALKADNDLEIVFPIEEGETLPVTLSSFTAAYNAGLFVNLQWVAESETEHAGYHVLRSQTDAIETAYRMNQYIINSGTPNGTQMAYSFHDNEIEGNTTYYYWLESISINGLSDYYGPITVSTSGGPEGPTPPAQIVNTTLHPAFPNPFNPNVFVPYTIKDAAKVSITIYNAKGQKVKSYSIDHGKGGTYNFAWDAKADNGKELGSGNYIIKMQSGSYTGITKAVLLK